MTPNHQHVVAQAAHQPLFEVATAYQKLPPYMARELQACFDGDRNLAQTHDIARRMAITLAPDALALVITRLICLADERPVHGGEVDIDLGALAAALHPPGAPA